MNGYEYPKAGDVVEADWLFVNRTRGESTTEAVISFNCGRSVTSYEVEARIWLKPIKPAIPHNYEHPSVGDSIGTDWLHLVDGKWEPYKRPSPQIIAEARTISQWLKPKSEFPLEIPGWKHDRTFNGWCVAPNNENCIALLTGNKTYIYLKIPKVCTECGRELE